MASKKNIDPKPEALPGVAALLHGGDYNPDQWLHRPDVLKEDLRLMKLAGTNAFSVNIFGWMALEPEEGRFEFAWLDKVLDDLNGIGAVAALATPSGSKPPWMSKKYPEIRRVNRQGIRDPHQGRHNACFSSPVYREKTAAMARRLAERYKDHPAVKLWHVNNEFNGGECHCDHCYAGFRAWLRDRYKTIEALNQAWWLSFWASAYTDFDQVEPLDLEIPAMQLDWRRFITHSCVEYFKNEIAPLREITPHIPLTTNFMGLYDGLDYRKLADEEDIASWDNYPLWNQGFDLRLARDTAFVHDMTRSLKPGKPFLMLESTPEGTNWMDAGKAKQPGMHIASSMQAVARGSDAVMMFQWRKGQGGFEQFHGAVVDHVGHENTRVFREVAELGGLLKKMAPVAGSTVKAEVALLYDWENRWAIDLSKGPRNTEKNHDEDCFHHYAPFWKRGISVDMVGLDSDLSAYRLLIAPMPFLLPKESAARIEAWVKAGGVLVTTYLAGTVDRSMLAWLEGRPGGLRKVLGLWAEEMDVLVDGEAQGVSALEGNGLGLSGSYQSRHYADVIHLEGAKALADYTHNYYASTPAVTENQFGKGRAFYLASRNEERFLDDLYSGLMEQMEIRGPVGRKPPRGVEISRRSHGDQHWLFVVNYLDKEAKVNLEPVAGTDLLTQKAVKGQVMVAPFGVLVVQEA